MKLQRERNQLGMGIHPLSIYGGRGGLWLQRVLSFGRPSWMTLQAILKTFLQKKNKRQKGNGSSGSWKILLFGRTPTIHEFWMPRKLRYERALAAKCRLCSIRLQEEVQSR